MQRRQFLAASVATSAAALAGNAAAQPLPQRESSTSCAATTS